ncbi:Thiosulfate sulfurtransferase sseB [Corynebacterium vitaeruminis DSM 20294]|uniref:Thiosulfate sulfurtransferase sseB n=4 Tax=Corynebacterium vitaeruminis TaxID=38305 RepID=W5Y466_9CORY|nr:Thiosulfate sulfurtransferase sseB [Corynebacterium vitaeruminis DSM 20294]
MAFKLISMSITITADELATRLNSGHKQTILAALWYHDGKDGYHQFNSEHISTSLFCDPALALAGVPGSSIGRNPLPSTHILERWFSKWGLQPGRQVVVYDNYRGLYAARAWWILRWAGIEDVVILDGGQKHWEASGYKTLGGPGNLASYDDVTPTLGHLPTATIDDVKAHDGLLIDAREANRFAGRKEFLDLKAGHIPGAINIPTREVMTPDHRFRPADELAELFASRGVTNDVIADTIIYSGSGNHSAQVIAAMNIAGLDTPRHYIGGWSQWSADPANPVERGDWLFDETREGTKRNK